MKKFVLWFCAMMLVQNLFGQFYVGGNLEFDYNSPYRSADFSGSVELEGGYAFNDRWSVCMVVGGSSTGVGGFTERVYGLELHPYVSYNVVKMGKVNFFLDGGMALTQYFSNVDNDGDRSGVVEVGISPGLEILLSDHFSISTNIGMLGYRHVHVGNQYMEGDFGNTGFGFNLMRYEPNIGFFYSF